MRVPLIRLLWVRFVASIVGGYATLLNRVDVKGAENIPGKGGVLIASNHISAYETLFLPWAVISRFPLQMLWAPAKEELFRNRFTGWLYSSWGAFPVNRGRDVKAAKRLNELLETEKVMIYPEGTRHKDGVLGKGNRGVGKIIYDVHPVVIPTAVIGVNHWRFPDLGRKGTIIFGEPVSFDDLFELTDCKQTHQLIVDRVMDRIADLLKAEGAYVNQD